MIRKPFAFATLLTACSLFAGLHSSAQAQQSVAVPVSPISIYSSTYISDNSWAKDSLGATLLFSVRGQNVDGSMSGCFSVVGQGWTSRGSFLSEDDYTDDAGEHTEVVAKVKFCHTVNMAAIDSTPAISTFHSLVMPDGTSLEGVETVDANGKVLYSTGRDANGEIIMVPVTRGSIYICH